MPAETAPEEQIEQPAAAAPEAAAEEQVEEAAAPAEEVPAEQLLIVAEMAVPDDSRAQLKALIEAVVYITDEPLTLQQIAAAAQQPVDLVKELLDEILADYNQPGRGLTIRELAGGYKMGTRPEHHEAIRTFVRNLKPPLKLSLPALETLAVIAYKQPITAPEIMDIRGVQGAGVLKTLLDRKLIATAGRKNVVGKPILYKTTREFLVQFGLKDLSELPTLKEFEELGRLALTDSEPPAVEPEPQPDGDPRPMEPPVDEPNEPSPEDEPKEPGPAPQPEGDPAPAAAPEQLRNETSVAEPE
ncbi:MAG TPA: SMC-Scp complex subunit ScpB [Bryobacteraceae bacterium]|nr:SMC-Scp complex subunit ScpB [Bryobacteraceae bacterium]